MSELNDDALEMLCVQLRAHAAALERAKRNRPIQDVLMKGIVEMGNSIDAEFGGQLRTDREDALHRLERGLHALESRDEAKTMEEQLQQARLRTKALRELLEAVS